MRIVVQKVKKAVLYSEGEKHSSIGKGMLVLVGVTDQDDQAVVEKVAQKVLKMRIFEDEAGKTNLNVFDAGGEVMVVSNFTLYGSFKGTNRPDFGRAGKPDHAEKIYDALVNKMQESMPIATGVFRTHMEIEMIASGPCTYLYEE